MAKYDDDELYRMHQKGQINDDEYLAGVEANCKHNHKIEEHTKEWIEYCDKCGMEHGRGPIQDGTRSSGTVKVTGGGCIVVGVMLIGAASAVGWAAAEALSSIF